MIRIIVFLFLLAGWSATECPATLFGSARYATPVLNSPDFGAIFGGRDGSSLKTDRCGQVRELEFIALPGTSFKIIGELKNGSRKIYQVETGEYPAPAGVRLYVDSRFLDISGADPQKRELALPPREEISAALKSAVGSPYVWGGNLQEGVPELTPWFFGGSAGEQNSQLHLAGLDCSGLLYQATGGWTPRNTARLLDFGRPILIKGKRADEITGLLEPLDLIIWNGHLVIVLDSDTTIESRLECGRKGNGGVVTNQLGRRLAEIMRTRRPVDSWPKTGKRRDIFVVRRWFGLQSTR